MESRRETDREGRLYEDDVERLYFQPKGVEGTFSRAFRILCKHILLFLTINTLAFAIIYAASLMLSTLVYGYPYHSYNGGEGGLYAYDMIFLAAEQLLFYAIQCIADGASIRAVAEIYAGQRKPKMRHCIKEAMRKALYLVGAVVWVGVWCFLFFLVMSLILNGVWMHRQNYGGMVTLVMVAVAVCACVAVLTYLMYPSIMVEGTSPTKSVSRSIRLSEGKRGYIFCVLLTFLLIRVLANTLITTFTREGRNGYHVGGYLFGYYLRFNVGGGRDGIVSIIFGIFCAAFGAILQAVVYFNIRVKTEDYTSAKLVEELGLGEQDRYERMGAEDDKRRNGITIV
mmetsp:Transcript_37135/g.55330  ORF Transcript_37135/g.55330 Transcript_37135/m.55330 type:complete len:341 (-) Transcript_37135:910-1932(-)|eukprot:CAMPEP_0194038454 /NCGR_PEP_ID=MMETSP0009_2-20130614/10688_1 /TAXON_ID=210454 /ORGANISM="Grammatophora oceanica, Strain CCMP 410" /LENGTH=340 /DNA_ID=CAMNT_0038680961 /DNA_START=214 /DNA_END=1236 /DNA_ORIENTATION=+